jgi:hypothetical protein
MSQAGAPPSAAPSQPLRRSDRSAMTCENAGYSSGREGGGPGGWRAARAGAVELAARTDGELGEDLAQVVLDRTALCWRGPRTNDGQMIKARRPWSGNRACGLLLLL